MSAIELDDAADELSSYIDADTLAQLRTEYPGAYYTMADGNEGPIPVVFKRLTGDQYKRIQAMNKDKMRADKVAPTTFRDIVVYPQGQIVKDLLEACPALDDQVATLALEIARGKAPEEAKKLRAPSAQRPVATSPSTPVR